jgi:hypothetical protein
MQVIEKSKKRRPGDDNVETEGNGSLQSKTLKASKVAKAAAVAAVSHESDDHDTTFQKTRIEHQYSELSSFSQARGQNDGSLRSEQQSHRLTTGSDGSKKNRDALVADLSQLYTDNIMAACMAATAAHNETLSANSGGSSSGSNCVMGTGRGSHGMAQQPGGNNLPSAAYPGQPNASVSIIFSLYMDNVQLRQRNEALQNELDALKQQATQLLATITATQPRHNVGDGSATSSCGIAFPCGLIGQQQPLQHQTRSGSGSSKLSQYPCEESHQELQPQQLLRVRRGQQEGSNNVYQSQQVLYDTSSAYHIQQQLMNEQSAFPGAFGEISNASVNQHPWQEQQNSGNTCGLRQIFGPNIGAPAEECLTQDELQQRKDRMSEREGRKEDR